MASPASPAAHRPPRRRQPGAGGSESLVTVIVAFGANLLIAVAKSIAAAVTGSASLLAEAAHSWADAGNEVFLLVANRRSVRPADPQHPFGHGREAYVWSLFAALGLFVAGSAISVTHGVQELINPEPASNFLVGYVVLAVSFVLEGISFSQSIRQAKPEAASLRPGPHRARAGHLRPDPAGGLRRGRGRADRPGDRRRRAGPAPADRVADAGRDRIDPGRRAARRGRGGADQPQPAVPGRAGGRPAGACRGDRRSCWTSPRWPG